MSRIPIGCSVQYTDPGAEGSNHVRRWGTNGSAWVKMISNLHEFKVVAPKVDRTKNKTPSLQSWGLERYRQGTQVVSLDEAFSD